MYFDPISIIIVIIVLLIILIFAKRSWIYMLGFAFAFCMFSLDEPPKVSGGGCGCDAAGGGPTEEDYQELRNNLFRKVGKYNKPISANYNDLRGYAVSTKLDGKRGILYTMAKKYYILFDKSVTEHEWMGGVGLADGIYDTEVVGQQIHIFDVLFHRGVDVRNYNLHFRISKAKEILPHIKNITIKSHIFTGNLAKDIECLISNGADGGDGLIFTNIQGGYQTKVYKAKPKTVMTLDFKIGENLKLLCYDKQGGEYVYLQLSTYTLEFPDQSTKKSGKLKKPIIKQGDIVECTYDVENRKFLYYKHRHDKLQPNHIYVARETLKQLEDPKYPGTYSDMIKLIASYGPKLKEDEEVRKFHNCIKKQLINQYAPGSKTVLDIGIGRGGDLMKYRDISDIAQIVGVEPNEEYLAECRDRMTGLKINNVELVKGTIEEYNPNQTFDLCCSFFSLSFFFDKPEHFAKVCSKLVAGKVKRFIGCTIDGEALRKIDEQDNQLFKIEKINETTVKFTMHGDTTVIEQTEYYVDWDTMVNTLYDHGYQMIETERFKPPCYFNANQSAYSSLFRTFVFESK